jgi:hypothetical protein
MYFVVTNRWKCKNTGVNPKMPFMRSKVGEEGLPYILVNPI